MTVVLDNDTTNTDHKIVVSDNNVRTTQFLTVTNPDGLKNVNSITVRNNQVTPNIVSSIGQYPFIMLQKQASINDPITIEDYSTPFYIRDNSYPEDASWASQTLFTPALLGRDGLIGSYVTSHFTQPLSRFNAPEYGLTIQQSVVALQLVLQKMGLMGESL